MADGQQWEMLCMCDKVRTTPAQINIYIPLNRIEWNALDAVMCRHWVVRLSKYVHSSAAPHQPYAKKEQNFEDDEKSSNVSERLTFMAGSYVSNAEQYKPCCLHRKLKKWTRDGKVPLSICWFQGFAKCSVLTYLLPPPTRFNSNENTYRLVAWYLNAVCTGVIVRSNITCGDNEGGCYVTVLHRFMKFVQNPFESSSSSASESHSYSIFVSMHNHSKRRNHGRFHSM